MESGTAERPTELRTRSGGHIASLLDLPDVHEDEDPKDESITGISIQYLPRCAIRKKRFTLGEKPREVGVCHHWRTMALPVAIMRNKVKTARKIARKLYAQGKTLGCNCEHIEDFRQDLLMVDQIIIGLKERKTAKEAAL